MSVFIPNNTDLPFFSQITNMDGVDYVLEFRYNYREEVYYLNISLTNGQVLAQGIKLVSNFFLFQAYASDLMPLGEMWAAVCNSSDDSPARIGELGYKKRVQLFYITQAEMQATGVDEWRL